MLSAKYRLKKKKDFERVYKKGQGLRQGFFTLRFKPNNLDNCRFGIVVSKKVANKANERNLIKRRTREAIKGLIRENQPSFDIVLISLPGISKKNSFQEIKENIQELFLKIGLIKQEQVKP